MWMEYTASRANFSSGTAINDLIILATTSSVPVIVDEIRITSVNTTDIRQHLRIIQRGTAHTGGTSVTPEPVNKRDTVASQTAVTSMPATQGNVVDVLENEIWSTMIPYHRYLNYPILPASWLAVELAVAPASAYNLTVFVRYREL